ncbi:unnamed protein product [Schistosoma margrebowiei]|uniref:G_PROTEIN_RECEP_F1_2 domain-containing protein n=1 Tax=Schistosoma margrebowiei TaxID=48269 RepID=A0AA84ZAI6_9TREM|nr:unnamed protein product [Schistosoma margrebowiei]
MIEDICSNSKLFLSKSLDFILTTNNQLSESNTNRMNRFLNNHNNSSLLFLNEYIKNVTEKLKGIQRFKQQLYICHIIHLLWMYIPPIIFILGSLGNILSFVILRHSSTNSMTIFVYLIARSIVDEIVLIIGLLRRWFDKIFDTKFENTSNFMCKMIHFWGTSSSLLSVWLTVSLTAERALVVSFPLHVSRLINYNRVRNLIIILSILCAILSLHFCFTVGITSNCSHKFSKSFSSFSINQTIQMNLTIPFINHNTKIKCFEQCSILPQYSSLNWYWSSFDAILYSYLPFCLIFTFNIIILKSVYYANKQRKQLHTQYNSTYKSSKNQLLLLSSSSTSSSFIKKKSIINQKNKQINNINDNIKQLTIMLLIISFSFLFTTFTIVFIKILAQNLNLNDKNKLNLRIYLRLIDTIAELFMYINHAMNFYLFCATGKTFRKRLFTLLLFNQCKYNKFNFKQNHYCFSCLLLYFTNSNHHLNVNKQPNKNEINQMKSMNKMNYDDVTITLHSQNINLYHTTQMNEIPSIDNKNTTMELISYRLSTSLINNSCHIYMNHNNEDNYDSDTINNNNNNNNNNHNNDNVCLAKSRNKLCHESNEQLSSIIKYFSKIKEIPNQVYYDRRKLYRHHYHRPQHQQQQQQEYIGRNFSFDENQHNIEDIEIKYLKYKSYKRQISKESLQTI